MRRSGHAGACPTRWASRNADVQQRLSTTGRREPLIAPTRRIRVAHPNEIEEKRMTKLLMALVASTFVLTASAQAPAGTPATPTKPVSEAAAPKGTAAASAPASSPSASSSTAKKSDTKSSKKTKKKSKKKPTEAQKSGEPQPVK
jgi:hypothetical protein